MKEHFQTALAAIRLSLLASMTSIVVMALMWDSVEMTLPICLGYGIVTLLSTFPVYLLSYERRWNSGPALSWRRLLTPLLLLVVLFFTVTCFSSCIYHYKWLDYFKPGSVLNPTTSGTPATKFWIMFACMAVLFVIQLFMVGDADLLIRNVGDFSGTRTEKGKAERKITILDERGTGQLRLDVNTFLYAESDANYLNVVCLDGNEIERHRLRTAGKAFEDALSEFSEILRCHRAYLVNVSNVESFRGNSSKGEITFKGTSSLSVPVSRTYIADIKSRLTV